MDVHLLIQLLLLIFADINSSYTVTNYNGYNVSEWIVLMQMLLWRRNLPYQNWFNEDYQ